MRWILIIIALLVSVLLAPLALLPVAAWAQSSLPNPARTPGAVNPAVSPATIENTICVRGWTRSVRPPVSYTEPLKKSQIRAFGYPDPRPWKYEEDHLIPLDLGGAPASPANLWPQPHLQDGEWGAYAKDRLEFRLVRLVCHHRLGLRHAQAMMATNWIAAYRHYLGPTPNNARPHHWHDHGHAHWHGHGHDHWHAAWSRSYRKQW